MNLGMDSKSFNLIDSTSNLKMKTIWMYSRQWKFSTAFQRDYMYESTKKNAC